MGDRAVIYTRISKDREGRALGVERQREDCLALAASRGWTVAPGDIFSDNDISAGGKRKRPNWERMLQTIEDDGVTVVLAYSSSRMYRRPADLQRLIDLSKTKRLDIATVVSGNIDLNTADGRMIAGLLATIDQGELERVEERVGRERKTFAESGRWHGGQRAFGYTPVKTAEGWILEVNETEAAHVREGATQLLNGASLRSVMRQWRDAGVRTTRGNDWNLAHLRKMFTRPLPGILTATDQAELQALFEGRKTGPHGRRRALLSGMLVCGACGGRMIARPRYNGKRGYVCVASGTMHLAIVARPVEAIVLRDAAHVALASRSLIDPSDPLIAEREKLVAEQEELGGSGLSVAAIRGRDRMLQKRIEEIDEQLANLVVDVPGAPEDLPQLRALSVVDLTGVDTSSDEAVLGKVAEAANDPALRAWLEQRVESVTVAPAKKGVNTFDPERVSVQWRDGVG